MGCPEGLFQSLPERKLPGLPGCYGEDFGRPDTSTKYQEFHYEDRLPP
jgi:hypothetical protein